MNLDYWTRRLLGKATCLKGPGTRLTAGSRIKNAQGRHDAIRIGSNNLIAAELFVFAHGGDIEIGDWCFIGEGTRVWSAAQISIGDRVLISHNVNIFDSLTHPLDAAGRHAQFKAIMQSGHPRDIQLGERPVTIGDDAWIGASSTILRGVRIGDRAVVGAGAVVTTDVPDDTVVAGNPARAIKSLNVERQ